MEQNITFSKTCSSFCEIQADTGGQKKFRNFRIIFCHNLYGIGKEWCVKMKYKHQFLKKGCLLCLDNATQKRIRLKVKFENLAKSNNIFGNR